MSHKLKLLSFLIVLLIVVSCRKEWFDIKSNKNITVPKDLKDFELMLDNFDILNWNSTGLGDLAADGYHITEATWNIFSSSNNEFIWTIKNGYTWSNNGTSYRNLNDWIRPYLIIAYANTVLEGLEKIPVNSNNLLQYNTIKGNALFHRARCYWGLSQIFAEPYVPGKDSPFGLPLKKDASATTIPERSTVHHTYSFIIQDLIDASRLLPNLPQLISRGSKHASLSLLSRIYLTTGEYTKCIETANSALQIKSMLIDYNAISSIAETGLKNEEISFFTYIMGYVFTNRPYAIIDQELYELYDNNDLRKNLYFKHTTNGVNFIGMYSNISTSSACIATDEVYLNIAEALARTNQISKSLAQMRTLLIKRFKTDESGNTTYLEPTITNKKEALDFILSERRKELVFRGIRWTDLRRLNQEKEFEITIERNIGGTKYILPPKSYKYTFPIPVDEIANFKQNPGW